MLPGSRSAQSTGASNVQIACVDEVLLLTCYCCMFNIACQFQKFL